MNSPEQYEHKRFEITSPAKSPHEYLHGLRNSWNELYADNGGFLVGMALYGSAVKGRFGPESDIDVMVFANPDHRTGPTGAELQDMLRRDVSDRGVGEHLINFDVREGHRDEKLVDVNEQIIDEFVEQVQGQYLDQLANKDTEDPEYFTGTKVLFGPFMMRVGNGKLREIRAHIFESIEWHTHSEEQADNFWQAIADSLYRYEEARPREDGTPASTYLPQKHADARNYFNLQD